MKGAKSEREQMETCEKAEMLIKLILEFFEYYMGDLWGGVTSNYVNNEATPVDGRWASPQIRLVCTYIITSGYMTFS